MSGSSFGKYDRRKVIKDRSQDSKLIVLFDRFTSEARTDREQFREELKDLAKHTDERIENLSRQTSDKIDRLSDVISRKFDDMSKKNQSDPKIWLQAGGLVLTFAGMAAALIVMHQKGSINPILTDIKYMDRSNQKHRDLRAHEGASSDLARIDERVKALTRDVTRLQDRVDHGNK